MGHALNNSIQDCLARYHRMRGRRTKWILGTDHAGIATQTQVERALIAEGTQPARARTRARSSSACGSGARSTAARSSSSSSASAPRRTTRPSASRSTTPTRRRCSRCSWRCTRRATSTATATWSTGIRARGSAISDLEVEQREVTDTLYYIDYPLASGSGAITVATVRPETMLADTAIAVHPEDERYRRLIGEKAILPLVGRKLRIIADEYVRPEFGTGALKITPAHDPNDFEIGRRHGLAQPSVIGEDGRITAEAPERFRGMTAAEAQQAVVAELSRAGADRPHRALRAHGAVLAPLRRADRAADLAAVVHGHGRAGQARDRGRDQRPGALPPRQPRQGLPRLDGEHPPLVHLAPAVVGPPAARSGTATWRPTSAPSRRGARAGSAIPTCSTRGSPARCGRSPRSAGPQDTPELRAFYPTDALVTGRDIIFLWVARMIMMGLEFTGPEPFSDVHITSIIQAPDGRRMSKSLGTGIDPLDLIEGGPRPPVFAAGREPPGDFPAYGADAVRWGLLAMSSRPGRALLRGQGRPGPAADQQALERRPADPARRRTAGTARHARRPMPTAVEDRWILSRLERARAEVSERIERFDFSHAALAPLRLRLRRAVRLVPGAGQAAAARRRARAGGDAAARADRDGRARPPADPVRDRGDLLPHPRRRGAAGAPASSDGHGDRRSTTSAEAAVQRAIAAVQALRRWRDLARVKAGAMLAARLEARRLRADTLEHLGRLARLDPQRRRQRRGAGRHGADPRRPVEILAGAELDLEAARARRPSAARQARGRDRARRAQARQRRVRGQGAAGGRRRPSATSSSGSETAELEAL